MEAERKCEHDPFLLKETTIAAIEPALIEKLQKLPPQRLAEVRDFVEFLAAREKQKSIQEATHAWTFKRLADDYLSRSASNLSPLTISGRRQELRDYVPGRIGHQPAMERSGRTLC